MGIEFVKEFALDLLKLYIGMHDIGFLPISNMVVFFNKF